MFGIRKVRRGTLPRCGCAEPPERPQGESRHTFVEGAERFLCCGTRESTPMTADRCCGEQGSVRRDGARNDAGGRKVTSKHTGRGAPKNA